MRLALLTLVAALATQQPSVPQATFRTGVDVVQVEVSVLDKDRHPIQGLTNADFTVLEDGKPRPIVAFVPVNLAEPDRASVLPAAWIRDVAPDVTTNSVRPEGRLVVIMFDCVNHNLVHKVKQDARRSGIPIVFAARSAGDTRKRLEAFRAGGARTSSPI